MYLVTLGSVAVDDRSDDKTVSARSVTGRCGARQRAPP
jgi:hypothetical protein